MRFLFLTFTSLFLISFPLRAGLLEDYWKAIQNTKEKFDIEDHSPKRFSFRLGGEIPGVLHKESLNHEIFWFCQKYIDKYHTNYPYPRYKDDIRSHLTDLYGDPSQNFLSGKLSFSCFSGWKEGSSLLKLSFFMNDDEFNPYRWDYYDSKGQLFLTEEDETKNGKKDSFTYYSHSGCPKEITKDKNDFGAIDEWWYYKNCQLVRIEYDANENGFRERICHYENGKESYCEGVGEKEEREAIQLENNQKFQEALSYYRKSLKEYKKEVPNGTSRTCSLLKKIANIEYNERDFVSFTKTLDEFFSYRACESDSLDVLIYKSYYYLYVLGDYKTAKDSYQKTSEIYRKTNGEISPEILLNLAYAQFMDKDPHSCLASLDKLNSRRLTAYPRFFLFYYRGSCELSLGRFEDAYTNLKRAQILGGEREFLPVVYYKLGRASFATNREQEGNLWTHQALLYDFELFEKMESDPLFANFFESANGKSHKRKYYLNKQKKQ
ncbi:tetratricopeptide repeat protein [Leptospira bandrabouensis]|uniref:tetratricopeptide repeat protein n=1 Tax=Leptospira bandrabouensis TaxID=2484903 RepID=UPI001EE79476|nr:tetratricopeptide repeat protein [Leptospira bandrabouensis]MCG6144786.1 tetratricopeptide repeat protein [Leptospira bandrabouensis]MCG6160577.1 tetratricopeptide repeat protein [Leptospira bandrabouensis]MCG6164509.1 tetratricopeptide repeat protein [Leptospira bandrabouensis]